MSDLGHEAMAAGDLIAARHWWIKALDAGGEPGPLLGALAALAHQQGDAHAEQHWLARARYQEVESAEPPPARTTTNNEETALANRRNNAINHLELYREGEVWMYDEPELEVFREPFVLGSSELITAVVGEATTCRVAFSSSPIPNATVVMRNVDSEYGDVPGWYQAEGLDHAPNWLCGRTLDYFHDYPDMLYVLVLSSG